MMLFVKDARGLSKSTNKLDGILLLCPCCLKLSLIFWSTHFPVSSNCTAIAMYFNFSEKLKFTKDCFVSQVFFLTWFTTGGAGYQKKKGQFWVKKSKTMFNVFVLLFFTQNWPLSSRDTVTLDQRACKKWMNNCGF